MQLTATDRDFLRGQFPGLRELTDVSLDRWFHETHYGDNPAYTWDDNESSAQ